MAKSGRKSKAAVEMEKVSTEHPNTPKKRKINQSKVDTTSKAAIKNNIKKASRKSLTSGRPRKGSSNKESSPSPVSHSTEKENEDANKEQNIVEGDNEEIPETKETSSGVTFISGESSGTKRKATKDAPVKKKQRVLLDIPQLPESSGDLLGVGENDAGQLGLALTSAPRPKPLKLEHNVVSVVAGGMHTIYLSEKGEVYTFGCNDEKALGRETADEDAAAVPAKVDIPESVVQISAGDSHSAVLTCTGKVYIWGNYRDSSGQMGLTSNGRQDTPFQILQGVKIVRIASGDNHFVCLSEEGILYTCGCAEQGQLGRIAERSADRGGRRGIEQVLTPAPVYAAKEKRNFDEIWTGSFTTFAREAGTGDIFGFGLNNYNQLGLPNKDHQFFPQRITSFRGKKWKMISGGQHHTIALDEDGKVYSLGRKEYGRLGLGENCEDTAVPTCIPSLADKKCTCICAGDTVSLAVTDDGKVYSWGMGSNDQLGHGSEEDVLSPQLISSKSLSTRSAISVSAGAQHAMIIARTLEKQLTEDNSGKQVESKENQPNEEQSTSGNAT